MFGLKDGRYLRLSNLQVLQKAASVICRRSGSQVVISGKIFELVVPMMAKARVLYRGQHHPTQGRCSVRPPQQKAGGHWAEATSSFAWP